MVTEWNALSDEIVLSDSINMFKNRIDQGLGHTRDPINHFATGLQFTYNTFITLTLT